MLVNIPLFLHQITHGIQQLLFPKHCVYCNARIMASTMPLNDNAALCAPCWGELYFITHHHCRQCQDPLPYHQNAQKPPICLNCTAHPKAIDALYSRVQYNAVMRHVIMRYKNNNVMAYARFLANMYQYHWQEIQQQYDDIIITFVPSHATTLYKRGFEHLALLAFHNAWHKDTRYMPHLLQKKQKTLKQKTLKRLKRQKNLQHSFMVNPTLTAAINNKSIVVIDDVVTTGATLNTIAVLCKKHGAKQVIGLSIAKTFKDTL